MTVVFSDAAGRKLSTVQLGPVLASDRGDWTGIFCEEDRPAWCPLAQEAPQ